MLLLHPQLAGLMTAPGTALAGYQGARASGKHWRTPRNRFGAGPIAPAPENLLRQVQQRFADRDASGP